MNSVGIKARTGTLHIALVAGSLILTQPMLCFSQSLSRQSPPQPTTNEKLPESPQAETERWDVPSLAGHRLQAYPPLLGEQDNLPAFNRDLVRVQWRPNDPIDLYIIRPVGVEKPPVVLFLYGFPSDTDKFLNDAFCQTLVSRGFAAVGFVSALTGHRFHDRPMKQWFVSELQESLGSSVHDVQMILDYLATRGDLNMNRVGIFGQGSGGTIAILSAAVDSRIQAVDLMDPWGDWPEWLAHSAQVPERERATYLDPTFLAKVAPLDPVEWFRRLQGRPVRLQESLFVTNIPERVRKQMEASATGIAEITEYRDENDYREKVATNGRMLDWMESKLLLEKSSPH